MDIGEDPTPLKETFTLTSANLEEAVTWANATAAHYEDPDSRARLRAGGRDLEISDPVGRQLAEPGDVLSYNDRVGFFKKNSPLEDAKEAWVGTARRLENAVGTPGESEAFADHKQASENLAGLYISAHPVPDTGGDTAALGGLPDRAELEAAKARHPSFSASNGLNAALPGTGQDTVTTLRGAARLN